MIFFSYFIVLMNYVLIEKSKKKSRTQSSKIASQRASQPASNPSIHPDIDKYRFNQQSVLVNEGIETTKRTHTRNKK